MNRDTEFKNRIILVCLFLSLFIIATILMFITPTSIKVTRGDAVTTSDGETISFNVFEPVGREGEKKPAVIIAHGIMASKEIMNGYAVELAAAGFIAVPFDFRGHSQSSGILDTSKIIEDVIAIKGYLSTRSDVDIHNLGYIAYSMGGFPGNIIIKIDPDFKCFIGVGTSLATNASDIRLGNSTDPLNVLIIQAKFDEAFQLSGTKAGIGLRIGLDAKDVDANKLYGSFNDGNATKIFYDDNTDHLLLAWDQDFIRESRNWVINTFSWVRPVDENFYVNARGLILILQCIGGIGFFFLILEPLSNLIVKAKEEDRYKIELHDETIKSLSIKTFGYSLGLGVIGMIILMPFFLFLPLSVAGMMAMFNFGSEFALFIMLWRTGKKADISVKEMIKGVFKRPQGKLMREIVLGVVLAAGLYIIIYLSIGLNYFSMAPYFIKILWIPPYYAVFFIIFLISGVLFQSIIQVKFETDLKNTYKVSLLIFCFRFVYFIVYILLLSLLMRSTFFMLFIFIATPLLILTSFVSTFLYQKTGNIVAALMVNTTIFVVIIGTASPFFLGLNMLAIFAH